MSSWIPSLFNRNHTPDSDQDNPTSPTSSSPSKTPRTAASGVKDDLSAVFRGVTAFLTPRERRSSSAVSSPSSDAIAGIKNDLVEIQGSFKSGLSLISSKLTSNFLQFRGQLDDDDGGGGGDDVEEEYEYDDDDAVGITEEVVGFVRKISTRPELWVDFPLSLADDFEMSDYQRDHAANIDYLVPELVTLRQKISSQISEWKFWIIYFILLFPRLSEGDLKLLSAPQVVEARETLLKKLQNKSNTVSENHSENSETINHDMDKRRISEGDESDTQHKVTSSEIVSTKKQVDNMAPEHIVEEKGSYSSVDAQQSENEDILFSDLEDDDLSEKILGSRNKVKASGWVQLNENSLGQGGKNNAGQSAFRGKESESEDSNDWLAVDDNDFDNLGAVSF